MYEKGAANCPRSKKRVQHSVHKELHEYFDTQAQKAIAAKICIGRRDYENGKMVSEEADNDVVNENQANDTTEDPATKKLCFTFGVDSCSESKND